LLPPLDPRSESVLRTLIETYLAEGEPVGSRLLSKRYPEQISSATIRNVLSDLEDVELLSQPHTSAGRVPTERAYRYYVDRWVHPAPPDERMGAQLAGALEGFEAEPELWLRHASKVLADVMQGVCVAVPFHLAASRLVRLEFVPLEGRRIVAVWVGAAGEVEHQIVDNPSGFPPSLLAAIGNFATPQVAGRTLAALTRRAGPRDVQGSWRSSGAELVGAGLGRLGARPDFGDPGRFRELVAAFEEHERLARLFNAFADSASRDVKLLLGSENPFLGLIPLSTAVRTVPLGRETWATFALVGPLRVDYARLLGGLDWWSRQLAQRSGGQPEARV